VRIFVHYGSRRAAGVYVAFAPASPLGSRAAKARMEGQSMERLTWKALTSKLLASLTIAAMLASVCPAAARAGDDAASLLAKHKAFAGWSLGDGTFKTLVTEWTVTRSKDGKTLLHFTDRLQGAVRRTDYKIEKTGLAYHGGFTGSYLWGSSENGFTTKVLGDAAKSYVSQSLLLDEAATAATGTLQGVRSIDGKSYSVVRVKIDASLPVDLYIGDTGAYRRAVIDPDGAFETTIDILETSEPLPGKKLISKFTIRGASYSLDKAAPNVAIAKTELQPPPATATWSFGTGDPISIKVTDKRIFVTAALNGVEGHFILDTGAEGIFLTDDFANRAHLEDVRASTAIGLGGGTKTSIRRAKTFTIGDNTLSNVIVSSGDVEFDADSDRDGRDGLIGFDLFGATLVALNLDEKTLSVFDPTKLQPDFSAGTAVLIDLSQQVPVVAMKLNDSIDVRATLDSGNPLYVSFDRALVTKNRLRFMVAPHTFASHQIAEGIGGFTDVECGQLDKLQLGTIAYVRAPACMGYSIYGISPSERDVLVGFDFLKHFNILFAYPASTLLLQRRKTEPI
jgi:hypothetical protein